MEELKVRIQLMETLQKGKAREVVSVDEMRVKT